MLKKEDQLVKLFEDLRLTKYLKKFQEEEVIYEDLKTLSENDLEDLIPKLIPRRRLQRFINEDSQAVSSSMPQVNSAAHAATESENNPVRKPLHVKQDLEVDIPRAFRESQPSKPSSSQNAFEERPLNQTEMVLVQGLVQTPHLNGIYILDSTRHINDKVFYRKRVGKAVLSWQLKPQWKVLKNGDWVTPPEGTGIWHISHDFESDLMVYVASSEDCPFIKPKEYDGFIWE